MVIVQWEALKAIYGQMTQIQQVVNSLFKNQVEVSAVAQGDDIRPTDVWHASRRILGLLTGDFELNKMKTG